MQPLKFYLVTDTHYFKNSLGAFGEAYEQFMDFEQKCFAETQAINEAVFAWLTEAKDADIVLIAGDLSFNGEKRATPRFHSCCTTSEKRAASVSMWSPPGTTSAAIPSRSTRPAAFRRRGRSSAN